MSVFGWQHNLAALVADKIFIVRWNHKVFSLSESASAAVIGQIELPALPFLQMDSVAQERYAPAAVADIQPRPPHKILYRGRLAALKVLASEYYQCLVSVHLCRRFHFISN